MSPIPARIYLLIKIITIKTFQHLRNNIRTSHSSKLCKLEQHETHLPSKLANANIPCGRKSLRSTRPWRSSWINVAGLRFRTAFKFAAPVIDIIAPRWLSIDVRSGSCPTLRALPPAEIKIKWLNPYLTNGFSHHYQLGESTFIFRGARSDFLNFIQFLYKKFSKQTESPQMGRHIWGYSVCRDVRLK